jgi:hypothetical protein
MSVTNATPTLTLIPTPTPYERGRRGIAVGLIVLGSVVALTMVVTIAVLGVMFATGTLRHTSQGWTFQAAGGSTLAAELGREKLDPKVYSLFVTSGSGAAQTAQFTAPGTWVADWTYSCKIVGSSFQVVAQSASQSFPAAALKNVGSGAGNSNRLPAGTYAFTVAADPSCSWSVGARPNH